MCSLENLKRKILLYVPVVMHCGLRVVSLLLENAWGRSQGRTQDNIELARSLPLRSSPRIFEQKRDYSQSMRALILLQIIIAKRE